ncbi:MAG: helix-turn-helix transcriptional regulator [Sedimenticola sp.]
MDIQAFRKSVGHRIKVRRVELDMKQEELGTVLGLTQAQISEWEIGRRALRIEQAMDLAKGLRTSVAYLVGESEVRG